jgi:beta-lactamase class A
MPFYYVLIILVTSCGATYFYTTYRNSAQNEVAIQSATTELPMCSMEVKRLKGYKFVKPLMFVDNPCESDQFMSLKNKLSTIIESYKSAGKLQSASVYLKEFGTNDWLCINENEKYSPGSLLKVPELITLLKMNELNPGFLNKRVVYAHPFSTDKTPAFLAKSIKLGQAYTVKELLTYMIAYSDNNATQLLNTVLDVKLFKKVFRDFGLAEPNWSANDYPISVRDYSLFIRAIYNASYLSIEDSEYAAELLSKCNFDKGMANVMPSNIKMAHKFGEAGTDKVKQLHETAILYAGEKTYVFTIMTKSDNLSTLPDVIKSLSTEVFNQLN